MSNCRYYDACDGHGQLCSGLYYNPQPELPCSLVQEVDRYWDDGSDETSYCWLLRLKDGRWAVAHGGHDYTGWDCRSGLESSIHPTREEAIRFGLTLEQRDLLGVMLPEDPLQGNGSGIGGER